tara:strand:- start:195 stop:512 length:318 start_codon:yes stop_codon:yes gene_type:complete
MIKIYGIKNCDKCRKAIGFFSERATFYDIRETPLNDNDICFFISIIGDSMINKSSATWRTLKTIDKQLTTNDLIKKYPLLMKRPLIVFNDNLTVGWSEEIKKIFI